MTSMFVFAASLSLAPPSAATEVPNAMQTAAPAHVALKVVEARVRNDEFTGEPVLDIRFDGGSRAAFAGLTARNVGRTATLSVDGRVLTRPVIQDAITGDRLSITGGVGDNGLSAAELQHIAQVLQAGGRIDVTIEAEPAQPPPLSRAPTRAPAVRA